MKQLNLTTSPFVPSVIRRSRDLQKGNKIRNWIKIPLTHSRCKTGMFHFIKRGIIIGLFLTLTAFASIQNGNFETGSYANWSSVSGTAFQNPADKSISTLISWEGSYYANSGYPDNTTWSETAVGVLRSDTFTYLSNRFILK